MRQLATIRTIKSITPIDGAEFIEVAHIDGWECVINKADGFKEGDKVVYIEVDSILPKKPEYEFMAKRKYRVRTIKLRGQISQGLVLPVGELLKGHGVGDDVTKELGITKYDPEAQQEQKFWKGMGVSKSIPYWKRKLSHSKIGRWFITQVLKQSLVLYFPPWIKKTDEERIQNMPILWKDINSRKLCLTATEKLDGTSATFFLRNGEFGVCSRNLFLVSEDDSPYWRVAKAEGMKSALKKLRRIMEDRWGSKIETLVLQGEIVGPSIQKNPYDLKTLRFYAFTAYINDEKIGEGNSLKRFLDGTGIKTVPILPMIGMKYNSDPCGIADLIKAQFPKKTRLETGRQAEGIVLRDDNKNISFKVLNPEYLLNHE